MTARSAITIGAKAVLWAAVFMLIGIVAYQLGQYYRLALTLDGMDYDSRFGIAWKAIAAAAFVTWFNERLRRR